MVSSVERNQFGQREKLPTLIIGYARLNNIRDLIKEAINFGVDKIYLHLDLGKNDELRASQEHFCKEIKSDFGDKVIIKLAKENLGVARSVCSAIDWFFSFEKSGVILEDDLIVTKTTFEFFRVAIPHLDLNSRCLLISGSTFLREEGHESELNIMWTNFPLIWGWATTSSRWKILKDLMIQPLPRKWFVSRIRGFLSVGAYGALTCSIDTWDSPIALGMWINKYLCMAPPHNLVSNNGADLLATHTKREEFPIGNPIIEFDISAINFVEPNPKSIKRANERIIRQNYVLRPHHVVAPLILRLRAADQGTLRRKLNDEF